MFINESKREIIVSKAEYQKAMKVGTEEFKALLEAKRIRIIFNGCNVL